MSDAGSIEETIFLGAREFSRPEERAAYLDQKCGGNPALRARVERMLNAEQAAEQFIAGDPLQWDPTALSSAGDGDASMTTIGPYKLLQQIGEGGCGIVYMAEQEQPIRRRVALKLIKPGMDSRQVIARFEAERQALAMMDHPNIARVLDAGTTPTGRPYFVMELVRGIRITDYCDQNNLSTRDRLELFAKVVHAVQHAHQKGIIHRDLKPSNLLITLHDGVPVPKVIDFGIAKALEQKLTDKTLFTQFEQFIGTPAYTSPEQAEMSGLDIDTRSDIYSLGVLLYELLVGQTPFNAHDLVQSGLDEMRRIIRDIEPARPSTRLSTMVQREVTTTAQRRRLSGPELIHLLKGDLDWIVMKCLEKDRTRRYETANSLANDIQCYLANEPVTARPPSRAYRLGKLVRRNKLAVAAGIMVMLALVSGIAVSLWQAARARQAEHAATEERESAEAVLQFFRDKVMAAGRPKGQEGGLGKDVTLREALDAAEAAIAKTFTNRPRVEAAIRKTLGESYRYLGEPAKAGQQLERALALCWRTFGADHRQTLSFMSALNDAGFGGANVPVLEEALRLTVAKFGPEHSNSLATTRYLGLAYVHAGEVNKAVPLYEASLRLSQRHLGPKHESTLNGMFNLGVAYIRQRRVDDGLALLREAVSLQKSALEPGHDLTRRTLMSLASALASNGRPHEALPLYEELHELTSAKFGPEHPATLIILDELATAYAATGMHERSLQLRKRIIELQTAIVGKDHPDTLVSVERLAASPYGEGRFEDALQIDEHVFKARRAKLGLDHHDTRRSLGYLKHEYVQLGRFAEAEVLLRECLRAMTNNLTATHHLASVLLEWAKADTSNPTRAREHVAEGDRLVQDYLARARLQYTNDPEELESALKDFAEANYRLGRFAEAEPFCRELLRNHRARLADGHDEFLWSQSSLGRLLTDWAWAEHAANPADRAPRAEIVGRAREAEDLLRECLASRLKGTHQTDWIVGDTRSRLGSAILSRAVVDPALDHAGREARLVEAERLLVEGQRQLQDRRGDQRKHERDGLERLVRLYAAWGKPDQLAAWTERLEAFGRTSDPRREP